MYAQRYHELYGWDERSRAKIAADQRVSACANPDAVFCGTAGHDRRRARLADDLGAAADARDRDAGERRRRGGRDHARSGPAGPATVRCTSPASASTSPTRRRPTRPTCSRRRSGPRRRPGVHDGRASPSPTSTWPRSTTATRSPCCCRSRTRASAARARASSSCATHDLSYKGDFPVNTHGGQLGYGQAGLAGGMSQVVEAVSQIQGRAGDRQLRGTTSPTSPGRAA